jgi:glycine cleavage system transcriptional repressor
MPTQALILLATGRDRPGIVERISGAIFAAGCNLEDSRMSLLRGEFALIVCLAGDEKAIERARGGLESLGSEMELTMQLKPASPAGAAPDGPAAIPYRLTAVAMDHPGIVHKVSRLLSRHGVNVVRLDTRLSNAPVSGTPVFALELEAQVPATVPVPKLRTELEALAEAESIDIELHAGE